MKDASEIRGATGGVWTKRFRVSTDSGTEARSMTTQGRFKLKQLALEPESFAALVWNAGPSETLTMSAETFARSPRPIRKEHPEWWMDNRRKHISMSLPIYALRDERRPGIGKFTDLGRMYRDVFVRQGIDTPVLLPPFQSTHISPYSPVSVYALNELYIDWTCVDRKSVV